MYLAPLNYDRFFKKVFSHTHIAKAFLEDFLDTEIEEIKLLERTHLLTNKSMKVEVDFRCKINGSYIIIDMQQWYKPDVVRRFYLYHCVATALQLEDLPEKKLPIATDDKKAKDVDYRKVEPVLTLIWMVDDSLQFKENFVAYTTAPEYSLEFINNQALWDKKNVAELIKERNVVYEAMQNTHKDLNFLHQNRLIFMFQNNIVKDEKFTKYRKWFDFAQKTKNKKNRAADFAPFKKEEVFKDVMKIILKKALDVTDLEYIETEDENIVLVNRYLEGVRADGIEIGIEIGLEKGEQIGLEKGEQIGLEKGEQIGLEKGEQIGLEKGEQIGLVKARNETILKLHVKGKSANEIADLLDVATEVVLQVIQEN